MSLERWHPGLLERLRAVSAGGRLPPVWLVVGEPGVGQAELGNWLASLQLCEAESTQRPCGGCRPCRKVAAGMHSDLVRVRRDPTPEEDPQGLGSRHEITVGQVRASILEALSLSSVEGRGRAVIVEGADALNVEAQNALLKILEEPPPDSLLVLLVERESLLLETLRSRCQVLRLPPVEQGLLGPEDQIPEAVRSWLRGRPGLAPALATLDAQALAQTLRALLEGRLTGAAFAQAVEQLVAQAAEGEVDRELLRRLALDVLHQQLRDQALEACTQPKSASGGSTVGPDQVLAMEAALVEAQLDIRRHLPEAVAWLALGLGFEAALLGLGSGGHAIPRGRSSGAGCPPIPVVPSFPGIRRAMTASLTFDERIATIAHADRRYEPSAYHFVFRALDFVLERRCGADGEPLPSDSHVSARELLDGLREYALDLYGPLARLVLENWGLTCTEDFGEIVFRLVECQLLNKQESDRKSDFSNGFKFCEAFDPVLPRRGRALG